MARSKTAASSRRRTAASAAGPAVPAPVPGCVRHPAGQAPQVLILHHQARAHPGVQLSNYALQQQLRACGARPLTLNWSPAYARTLGLQFSAAHENFHDPGLELTPPCYSDEEIAAYAASCTHVLIGAGAVFENRLPTDPTWPLLRYCGDFVRDDQVLCAYAARFGRGLLHATQRLREEAAQLLRRFDRITLSDGRELQVLEDLTGRSAELVPDPVFMPEAAQWLRLADTAAADPPARPYAVCMCRQSPFRPAADLSGALGALTVVALDWQAQTANQPLGVAEWLALIARAELVVSDDYYCLALSLILGRPCAALMADEDAARVQALFTELGLEQLLLRDVRELTAGRLQGRPDMAQCSQGLLELRARGRACLQELLALQPAPRSAYALPADVARAR